MFLFPRFEKSVLWLAINSHLVETVARRKRKGVSWGTVGNPLHPGVLQVLLVIWNMICLLAASTPCQKSLLTWWWAMVMNSLPWNYCPNEGSIAFKKGEFSLRQSNHICPRFKGGVRGEKSFVSRAPSLSLPFHLPSPIVDLVELFHCSCLVILGAARCLWRLQLWLA